MVDLLLNIDNLGVIENVFYNIGSEDTLKEINHSSNTYL